MCLFDEQPLKTQSRRTTTWCPTSQLIDCFMDEDCHAQNGE